VSSTPTPSNTRSRSRRAPWGRTSLPARTAGAAIRASSVARGAWRTGGRIAHRVRYLPLALAALGAMLVAVGPTPRPVPGDQLVDNSMAPTLTIDEPVTVDRGAFAHQPPRIGEIVTFHPPVGERCTTRPPPRSACPTTARAQEQGEGIKRIVAGPGDRVALRSGRLLRNGLPVSEPYNRWPCVITNAYDLQQAVNVPPGTWWLLADNRNALNDSRSYGPIPTAWITGLISPPAGAPRRVPALPSGSGVR